MSDTKPKVVLVTGCAKGGIGYEYCKAFAEHNCHVIASDIPPRMSDMSDLTSDNIDTLPLDVSSDESASSAVETIMSKHGRIDVLVNNAGVGSAGPLAELSLDRVRRAWEVNALGQLRMVQRVVPHMARQDDSQRRECRGEGGDAVGGVVLCEKSRGPRDVECVACRAEAFWDQRGAGVFGIGAVEFLEVRLEGEEWKMYGEFKEAIAERATEGGVFARHIVRKVLVAKPPKEIAFGHMTALFGLLSWSSLWARDLFFSTRFKVNKRV